VIANWETISGRSRFMVWASRVNSQYCLAAAIATVVKGPSNRAGYRLIRGCYTLEQAIVDAHHGATGISTDHQRTAFEALLVISIRDAGTS
jgi:hypothetical protein